MNEEINSIIEINVLRDYFDLYLVTYSYKIQNKCKYFKKNTNINITVGIRANHIKSF